MPFQNEKAGGAALKRILSSEKVEALHARFKRAPIVADKEKTASPIAAQSRKEESVPKIILAIDGGYHVAPVESGYPGAEIGYLTIASVLIFLDKLRQSNETGIINPVKFRAATDTGSIDLALPGRGVLIDNEPSGKFSMRKTLFEEMKNYRVFKEFDETLLDTYEHLAAINKPFDRPATKCPCEKEEGYQPGNGRYDCDICGIPLYSTDALRCHELFLDTESCEKMYGQVMAVLERLLLIHILRAFEAQGKTWLSIIGNMAFVIDGPLAIYGTSAWLHSPVRRELARLNRVQKAITGKDMLILGIEKSGGFVNHLEMLDTDKNENPGLFPSGHYQLITNAYIRRHIQPSDGGRLFGRNTYFGRKMFYKTATGQKLVVNFVCYDESQFDITSAEPRQYVRLDDALGLLDAVSSSMYPNSISPLIAAHAEASIPLNLGRQVLDKIARESVQSPK